MPPRTAVLETCSDAEYELNRLDGSTRLGNVALTHTADTGSQPESRESRSRTQTADFLWKTFRGQLDSDITPTQAAFALEMIENLYGDTKTVEQVQERVREKLCLHFAGYSDTEIASYYHLDLTEKEVVMSRAAIVEALQNDYNIEDLQSAFGLIATAEDCPPIADLADEAIRNIENLRSSQQDTAILGLVHENQQELEWQQRALCAQTDPEAFYPEAGGSTREAKKVCLSCDVRTDCLKYALDNDERFGIWGGLSERERRRLKKQVQ